MPDVVGARVHRSFVHRHPDLHAAVLQAAADAVAQPSPAATTISHRSVLAENANLHEQNRRLAQHVRDLADRLSENRNPAVAASLPRRLPSPRFALGLAKVTADFSLLAAAVNLARLAVLGVTRQAGGWTVAAR